MTFLIIIPAHNEEKNILHCLKSLRAQTFTDFQVIVVNDGSTDQTEKIVETFIGDYEKGGLDVTKFTIRQLPASDHQPGGKVVKAFERGLEGINLQRFQILCKFDADIIFPENYLQRINDVYENRPDVGMVSGLVKILDVHNQWVFENISSKDHIRGPIKSYRKECYQQMGGLRPVLGWDNIDVMLAQKVGWKILTIKDLWVKHLRPTASKYRDEKARKMGEYLYNIGLNLPLAALSSAKAAMKDRSVRAFFLTIQNYLKQKSPLFLDKDEIKFIRKLRWQQIFRLR